MVLPLIIAGVAMAVGAIMKYYNSEKARGATADRLKQIEAMFDKIKPPDIDLKVYDDPKLASRIPSAHFDFSKITPEEYKLVQNIAPEAAPYVAERAPQLVKATQNAETGREAQLEALRRYKSIAQGESDPEFQQLMLEASRKARGDAQSRQATILENFARRGVSGPGAELALSQQGASDAMQTEAITGQRAAADAYRNRLEALAKGAQLGGQVRESEMGEQKSNADIINDYNQRSSKRYQDYLNARADSIYDARVKQETTKQRLDDANVTGRNNARVDDVERQNKLAEMQHGNEIQDRQFYLDLARQKAGAQMQGFDNKLQIARGKAGVQGQGIDYMRSDAADHNKQIQGATDTAGAGAMYYDHENREDKRYGVDDEEGGDVDENGLSLNGKYGKSRRDDGRIA